VRAEGLEPPHLSTTGPKPAASTNSATRADAVGGAAYNRHGPLSNPQELTFVGEQPCNSTPHRPSTRLNAHPSRHSPASPANRPPKRRFTSPISTFPPLPRQAPIRRQGRSHRWVEPLFASWRLAAAMGGTLRLPRHRGNQAGSHD
jgi:hypothetical protein